MRHLLYILVYLCCFSCAQKEERMDATETTFNKATPEALEVVKEEAAAMETDELKEPEETVALNSDAVIHQQLQETLNLIVLQNKLDIDQDLKTALEESIAQKVERYTIDHTLDVLKVTTMQVLEQKETSNQQEVRFSFEALDKKQNVFHGQAMAVITTNSVNIDGQDYIDYRVYFKEIVVE